MHQILTFYLGVAPRRKFLDEFAKSKGFDPVTEAVRWYTVAKKDILLHV
jgi:hypothetical protein